MFMDGAGNINILGRFQAMPKIPPNAKLIFNARLNFTFNNEIADEAWRYWSRLTAQMLKSLW